MDYNQQTLNPQAETVCHQGDSMKIVMLLIYWMLKHKAKENDIAQIKLHTFLLSHMSCMICLFS